MADILTPGNLLERVAKNGERPCVLTVKGAEIETWTCDTLVQQTQRLATGLLQDGATRGETVAFYGPNRPEWVCARLAVGAAGLLAAPFDDLLPEAEVVALIRDSGSQRVFTTHEHATALLPHCGELELSFYLLDSDEDVADLGASWRKLLADSAGPLPEIAADDPAMIVYTSGTTGAPKSFLLTYANISANVNALTAAGIVGPEDRILVPLPLDNVYPYVVGLLTTLANGAAVIFPEAITGPDVIRGIALGHATGMIGVPRLYAALVSGIQGRVAGRGRLAAWLFHRMLATSIWLQRRLGLKLGRRIFAGLHRQFGPSLELLACGGARLDASLVWTLEGLGWEVRGGYGLAEVGSVFTGNTPGNKRIGSEGRPIHGGGLRIAEPDEDGIGEIQLSGPSVFSGYRNNPEANRLAFTEDGWFHTGDLGALDSDGFLYITGRVKEMIVLGGGKNVFPEELERTYAQSPFIEEIAVLERSGSLVGLVHPDLKGIEASGYARIEDALRVSLADLSRVLPSFQRLSGFAIVREPLPRTRLGKYRRFLLPEIYEAALTGAPAKTRKTLTAEDQALLSASPAKEVWAFLKSRYPDKEIELDANPQLDLGIDSLEWVTLTLELEGQIGVRLSEADLARITTLRDLLNMIAAAPRQAPKEPGGEAPAPGVEVVDPRMWLAPAGALLSLLNRLIHGLNAAVMRLFFRLKAEGTERLPAQGPCLLVVNHASDLDPAALAAALPPALRHDIFWGADVIRVFANPVGRLLAKALHLFPVDERAPAASLDIASAVLSDGHVLAWFPESWRSPDGTLQRFFPGVGSLVANFDGPVIPVLISGTFEAMPRWRRWPRPNPIKVRFGPAVGRPIFDEAAAAGDVYPRIAKLLHDEVAALIESKGTASPS